MPIRVTLNMFFSVLQMKETQKVMRSIFNVIFPLINFTNSEFLKIKKKFNSEGEVIVLVKLWGVEFREGWILDDLVTSRCTF